MTSPLQQLLCFEARRDGSIDARFAAFHRYNPRVWGFAINAIEDHRDAARGKEREA